MHVFCFTQAELNEVLEMDDESSAPAPTPTIISPSGNQVSVSSHSAPRRDTSVESRLTERIDMYKTAICNAKDAGETNKVRRYERGLKVKIRWKKAHPYLFLFTTI